MMQDQEHLFQLCSNFVPTFNEAKPQNKRVFECWNKVGRIYDFAL
jgi:hypothetical protein